MKAKRKEIQDANALLKSMILIYGNQTIQNIYGEGLTILYRALEEVEIEKDIIEEEKL